MTTSPLYVLVRLYNKQYGRPFLVFKSREKAREYAHEKLVGLTEHEDWAVLQTFLYE